MFESVLVTGATGFLGRRVAKELYTRGKRLRCLVRATSNLDTLKHIPAEIIYGDITDPSSLAEAVKGVEAIIHLVAVIDKGKTAFERVNYQGTKNLILAAKRAGVKRLIYMSNIGACPQPSFPFLYSKWKSEEEIKASGLSYTIFRSSVMFGEGDRFIGNLAQFIRLSPIAPIIGNGKTRFQLISADEVAKCLTMALDDEGTIGQIISLGGPQYISYEEIIDIIILSLGVKRLKLHIPIAIMRHLVWLMERCLPHPPLTLEQLKMLSFDNITELDTVEKNFGFKPTPLRQGIIYIKSSPKTLRSAQR